MAISRYPCRVCGRSTTGEDSYVICDPCLADLEPRTGEPKRQPAEPHPAGVGGPARIPLSPDEVKERLRRLLDDW